MQNSLSSSDWAAWVQAVGSISAIAVAIWLSRRDSKERARERRARSRNAAIQLAPYFRAHLSRLEAAMYQKSIGRRPDNYQCDLEGRTYGLLEDTRITDEFKGSFGLAAMLGDAEAPAQIAFLQIRDLYWLCRNHARAEDHDPSSYYFEKGTHDMLWKALDRSIETMKKAVHALDIEAKDHRA